MMPDTLTTAHSEFCTVEIDQVQAVNNYLQTLAVDVDPTGLAGKFTTDLISFSTPFFGTTEQDFFVVTYKR